MAPLPGYLTKAGVAVGRQRGQTIPPQQLTCEKMLAA